ncbi:MAG TPA: PD-(D/E)XK nuclease family protein [Verrucomicrobiae bacterium]|jgi:hypothetical protein
MSIITNTVPGLSVGESLEDFMREVAKRPVSTKERTIFSLGGRGYYENATSDMLAFFLRPDAEHGFGTLFLSTFFDCMCVSERAIPELSGVTIGREIRTNKGNFIDLQILSGDFCLIIENKIRHKVSNPFGDYETHAKALRNKTYFAILAPHCEISQSGWTGISYANYCATLRERLGKAIFAAPHSKWHLFAREFILHIENELYTPAMNQSEIDFVESHTLEITKVQKLKLQYHAFFLQEMQAAMDENFPKDEVRVHERSWFGFAIVVYCDSSKWNRIDSIVIYKSESKGENFSIRIYVKVPYDVALLEACISEAKCILETNCTPMPEPENKFLLYWTFPISHSSAKEAIAEFCKFVKIMEPVLK